MSWDWCRQTQRRTGRQALKQVSFRPKETGKPYISLALLSYWTLKLSRLHWAPCIQPQSEEKEFGGHDLSLPAIFLQWMTVIALICFEICLQCSRGLLVFPAIMDVLTAWNAAIEVFGTFAIEPFWLWIMSGSNLSEAYFIWMLWFMNV